LIGYTPTSHQGNYTSQNLVSPQWVTLSPYWVSKFSGKNVLCKLSEYKDSNWGYEQTKGLIAPVYNDVFLLNVESDNFLNLDEATTGGDVDYGSADADSDQGDTGGTGGAGGGEYDDDDDPATGDTATGGPGGSIDYNDPSLSNALCNMLKQEEESEKFGSSSPNATAASTNNVPKSKVGDEDVKVSSPRRL
jgi:hypothetical protein